MITAIYHDTHNTRKMDYGFHHSHSPLNTKASKLGPSDSVCSPASYKLEFLRFIEFIIFIILLFIVTLIFCRLLLVHLVVINLHQNRYYILWLNIFLSFIYMFVCILHGHSRSYGSK